MPQAAAASDRLLSNSSSPSNTATSNFVGWESHRCEGHFYNSNDFYGSTNSDSYQFAPYDYPLIPGALDTFHSHFPEALDLQSRTDAFDFNLFTDDLSSHDMAGRLLVHDPHFDFANSATGPHNTNSVYTTNTLPNLTQRVDPDSACPSVVSPDNGMLPDSDPLLKQSRSSSKFSTHSSSDTSSDSRDSPRFKDSNHAPTGIKKRTLNTLAARRYRQRRTDQVAGLEIALKETEAERDALKNRVARLEGELDVLRRLTGTKV